jgi:hypothetical protein
MENLICWGWARLTWRNSNCIAKCAWLVRAHL